LARFPRCERKLNLHQNRRLRLNPFPHFLPQPVPEAELKAQTIWIP